MKIEKSRDASKRLTVEIFNLKKVDYEKITLRITKQFNLIALKNKISTPDTIFQTYSNERYTINLEWDNWSGYIIVAKNIESEKLIDEIYNWLLLTKFDN